MRNKVISFGYFYYLIVMKQIKDKDTLKKLSFANSNYWYRDKP